MKKVLFFLLLGAVAPLSAVTIAWSLPHSTNTYAWPNEIGSFDIVYSETPFTSYEDVAKSDSKLDFGGPGSTAANRGNVSSYVPGESKGTTVMVTGETLFSGLSVTKDLNLYLVVHSTNKEYMVYNVGQYTGNPVKDQTIGIYQTTVNPDPDNKPDAMEFYTPDIMGGTWKAATTPEPTVLALLALGVAGFVLRRKA